MNVISTMEGQELVREALGAGAVRAALVDTSTILFHEEFRKACERNACGKYDTNWMGPPAVGPIEALAEKVRRFKHGLLFQTVWQIASSFDMKGMVDGAAGHNKIFRILLHRMKELHNFADLLPLSAGCCSVCPRCAYLDGEPCRNPDDAISSVEAYGIDVMALVKEAGMPYSSGKNTVSYVGLMLFRK